MRSHPTFSSSIQTISPSIRSKRSDSYVLSPRKAPSSSIPVALNLRSLVNATTPARHVCFQNPQVRTSLHPAYARGCAAAALPTHVLVTRFKEFIAEDDAGDL